jgi:hypothetical protein
MERHIHEQNLAHYRRLTVDSERDPAQNEVQHNWRITASSQTFRRADKCQKADLRHLDRRIAIHVITG